MADVIELNKEEQAKAAEAEKVAKEAAEKRKADKEKKVKDRLKGYELRELNGSDIFKVLEIAEALNVSELLLDFFKQRDVASIQTSKAKGLALVAAGSEDKTQITKVTNEIASIQESLSGASFDIIGKATKFLLSNISTVKSEINSLLADLLGKTEEDVSKLNIVVYTLLLKSFFEKPELKELFDLLV